MHPRRRAAAIAAMFAIAGLAVVVAACADAPAATPPITPGTGATPREVNVIAREYTFVPDAVDLVPGETVILHLVNGGLETHEAVIGDGDAQAGWEAGEAAVADHPPGPTPLVEAPPGFDGVRLVAGSGTRVDAVWTVPPDAASQPWFVGCHIPGHFSKGMVVPVRFVGPDGRPLASPAAPASSGSQAPEAPQPSGT